MLKQLKVSLTDYFNSLTIYDYTAFGWFFFLLFIFIFLAMILMKKSPKVSSFLILTTFILMIFAPFTIKYFLDKTVRATAIVDQNHTKLNFSKYLVVTGKVENRGKIGFHRCYISAKVHKVSENKYINMLNFIKPIRKRTIMLDGNISQRESKEFKVVFEQFDYEKDYKVAILAECY